MPRFKRIRPLIRRFVRIGLYCLAGLIGLVALAVLFLPCLLPILPFPEITIDLDPYLPESQKRHFADRRLCFSLDFERNDEWDLFARGRGSCLGQPLEFVVRANYSLLHLTAEGKGRAKIPGSVWHAAADFSGELFDGWEAHVNVPSTAFTEEDPVVAIWRDHYEALYCPHLALTGNASFSGDFSTRGGRSEVHWDFRSLATNVLATWGTDERTNIVRDFTVAPTGSGIGSHSDLGFLLPQAKSAEICGLALTNLFSAVLPTKDGFLATTSHVNVYGGQASVHSLYLRQQNLDAGFTLLLDDIEADSVINLLAGFAGKASGRLHGKMPLQYRDGKILLRDAFLYSRPGETGRLQLEQADPILGNLRASGVSERECANLERALRDMNYNALRFELREVDPDEETYVLSFFIEGSATAAGITVPVHLDVNLHGPLEQLLNLSLAVKKGIR